MMFLLSFSLGLVLFKSQISLARSDYVVCVSQKRSELVVQYQKCLEEHPPEQISGVCGNLNDKVAKAIQACSSEEITSSGDGKPTIRGELAPPDTGVSRTRVITVPPPAPRGRPGSSTTTTTTPRPGQAAPATPSPSTPPGAAPTEPTTQQIAQDVASCESTQSPAVQCCGNPMSCSSQLSAQDQQALQLLQSGGSAQPSNTSQAGLRDYCMQMESLSQQSGNLNASFAGICQSRRLSCTNTCSQMLSKYQNLLGNCSDCENASSYANAVSRLQSIQSTCDGLQAQALALGSQSLSTAQNSAYAQHCQSQTNSQLQNFSSGGNSGGSGFAQPPPLQKAAPGPNNNNTAINESVGSKQNPDSNYSSSNSSSQAQAQRVSTPPEQAEFSTGENFGPGGYTYQGNRNLNAAAAPTVNPVANNSGGGVPSAAAGSVNPGEKPAALAPQAANSKPSPGSPGFSSDSGGGGYQSPSYPQVEEERTRSLAQSRKIKMHGSDEDTRWFGLDLKQFLPGGRRDPRRHLGGSDAHNQINRKEENIWLLISNKMIEKCKLGVLLECQ